MSHPDFELKILRQHWVRDDGQYDKADLCSHGEVYIRFGPEVLSNKEAGSWSLSPAGLFLMRSLDRDCEFLANDNQMIPCCGHSIFPNDEGENLVHIMGCQSGVDWKVKHTGQHVELTSEKGTNVHLRIDQYKDMVLAFVNGVERFFGDPKEKSVEGDAIDQVGFTRFWMEWAALKKKWI